MRQVALNVDGPLLASKALEENFNAVTYDTLCAFHPISIRTHLIFDDEHGKSVQNRPQDTGQRGWVAAHNLPSLLAAPDHFGTTIDAAAAFIEQTYGKLDILVNNAGISTREGSTPPSELALEDLLKTFATNVFGAFAVTKAMLPLLRRSEAGRIVNLSSEMGSLSINSDPTSFAAHLPPTLAYNASKTALNALTVYFANALRNTPIKINSVSPGFVATDLNGHSGFLTPEQGAKMPVAFATLPADGPHGGFYGENGSIPW